MKKTLTTERAFIYVFKNGDGSFTLYNRWDEAVKSFADYAAACQYGDDNPGAIDNPRGMLIGGATVQTLRYTNSRGQLVTEPAFPESLSRFLNARNFGPGEMTPHNHNSPAYVVSPSAELYKYYGMTSLLDAGCKSVEIKTTIAGIVWANCPEPCRRRSFVHFDIKAAN